MGAMEEVLFGSVLMIMWTIPLISLGLVAWLKQACTSSAFCLVCFGILAELTHFLGGEGQSRSPKV